MSFSFPMPPTCPTCQGDMNYVDGWCCLSEDCPEFDQPYTLNEIENREEAAFVRSTQPTINGERREASR